MDKDIIDTINTEMKRVTKDAQWSHPVIESPLPPFEPFASIKRISRGCTITEKLDGTNGLICILEDGRVLAGSRTRWIPEHDDNAGFANWVAKNADELRTVLGVGKHYGEWWGKGIQRRYGLNEKRFSLFNTSRWNKDTAPKCCSVVPVLYEGIFTTDAVEKALEALSVGGSAAAPGFFKPEGVVIYMSAANCYFKKTLLGDGHKSAK
jgi:hypothetical protein